MIAVLGAGPAGLAASLAASENGERVLLIDGAHQLGGQYWRHSDEIQLDALGARYLSEVKRSPRIEILLETQVWNISYSHDQISLHVVKNGITRIVTTRSLILATGAYDRTIPFPGWDLPGVMTAGGAQALLKGSSTFAGKRIVVAGTGPFLLPVAEGLSAKGAKVVGLFEANRLSRWIPNFHVALANPSKLIQALKYFRSLRSRHVITKTGFAVIRAHADANRCLTAITVARIDKNFNVVRGTDQRIECDCLAVSWGFTADLSLATNLELEQHVGVDGGLCVVVNSQQQTSKPGIFAAGEITGIGGSELAIVEGRIAGYSAANAPEHAKRLLRAKKRRSRFANAILRSYPVRSGWQNWLDESTIVCRCEEVFLKDIDEVLDELGADNARTTKLLSRAGMGLCQGRICGRSVTEIVAMKSGKAPELKDQISLNKRPIVTPMLLGTLAASSDIEYTSDNQ